ncbi:MAG: hypothetical protein NWE94_00790 [Candidatus Bathyarchaeota archaeon]|nr:hypothetical protein [Candidatus Bathyarchaeota archaeon]
MQVYYKTDWKQNETYVYNNEGINIPYDPNAITEFSYNINLTGVPEGKHYVTVYAVEWGAYIDGFFVHMFSINGSSSVNFAINVVSPSVSVLSPVNETYDVSDVPLNFTVSEPISEVTYSLDRQENVTITGNTTLTLSNGVHNVTVYVWDVAGNAGASETIHFNVEVPESFSPAPVAAGVTSVAVVGIGVLIYFKKRKHETAIPHPT